MIKEYRKNSTIHAEQFTGTKQMIDQYHIRTDTEYAYDIVPYEIETLEGWLSLKPDDWITTGVNGEHWAIKDDIFKKTYEVVKW